MTRKFKTLPLLLLFAAAFSTPAAQAIEYDLPDPPGTMTFNTVPLQVVAAPNEQIPANCETRYRAGMESAFTKAWSQCQQIGKQEPSDCQRAVFARCTNLASSLQKMEAQTCVAMMGESDAIAGFQAVDTQKTSQSSTSDLNARAYVATQKVITGLQASATQLTAHRQAAVSTMNAGACSMSTAAQQYLSSEKVVGAAINQAQAHVQSMIQVKQTAAAQFAKNSGKSAQNLAQLVSAAPASTITGSVSSKDTAITTIVATSTGTATVSETVISTSSPTSMTTAASSASGTYNPPNFGATPAAPPPPMLTADSGSSNVNWLPILAVAAPAAILTGIVIAATSKNKASNPPADPGNGGAGGASDPTDSTGPVDPTSFPSSGGRNPKASVIPGGGDLAAWNITVDPSFTDVQRANVAAALNKIPSCYRYKLQGIHVVNRNLQHMSDRCVAGMFVFGGDNVYLSPSCASGIGITVHEFFHVLGNRNNNELHQQWKPVFDAHPNCPVTEYGKTNFFEDFAESGRLLEARDSSAGPPNPGDCVQQTIQGLGKIMNRCPGQ